MFSWKLLVVICDGQVVISFCFYFFGCIVIEVSLLGFKFVWLEIMMMGFDVFVLGELFLVLEQFVVVYLFFICIVFLGDLVNVIVSWLIFISSVEFGYEGFRVNDDQILIWW